MATTKKKRYIELVSEPIEDTAEKELYEQRVIIFNDDVYDESINALIKKMLILDFHNDNEITILFNTDGGCPYESLQFYDFVRSLRSKVNIHVGGRAFSAGVFIIGCCATGKRTCSEHTSFMYHPSFDEFEGKTKDLLSNAKEVERIEKALDGLMEKHTKLKEVTKKFDHDIYFNAITAKKWGIVDEIMVNKK